MKRFLFALVCAVMVFLGAISSPCAGDGKRYVHWTMRQFDGGISLDRPWIVDDDISGNKACESRNIPLAHCFSSSNDASKCASVVTYSYVTHDGKRSFTYHEAEWPAKRNREFVENSLGKIFKDVHVIDSDERCGKEQSPGEPPRDKTPRS